MRLIYAVLMLAGFALLLWSIDQSMPVFVEAVADDSSIQKYSPICKGQTRLWGDESYLSWDDEKSCFMLIEIKSGGACQDNLKEAEEALSACEAQLDSCRPE